ncbi:MAG: hypothetical protein E3K36_10045 [Candidatus Brocadia sp.]|nr:hypothetical protein [Candidatus Brocadia sp.]
MPEIAATASLAPLPNTWLAASVAYSTPSARIYHTTVWTGTQMIVWGGYGGSYLNTGGCYSP